MCGGEFDADVAAPRVSHPVDRAGTNAGDKVGCRSNRLRHCRAFLERVASTVAGTIDHDERAVSGERIERPVPRMAVNEHRMPENCDRPRSQASERESPEAGR